ncbi:MAG: hypothetical protein FWD60_08250 [Candidatus Azobacteroides sp.]|nr:hypothetical protein [Candidatus Azobacteroides sp.]
MLKDDLKHITTEHLRDTNQISVRTANSCISSGLNTLYEILLCFEDNGSFFKKKMKNAGRKTCEELDELCVNITPKIEIEKQCIKIEKVVEIICELTEQEREMLLSLVNLIVETENIVKQKKRIFENYCANNFSFAIDFYTRNGHLPMFWILEQYIINDKSREIEILISAFKIFPKHLKDNIIVEYEVKSLEEIAEKYSLTRERVRQIRNNVYRKTFEITNEIIEYGKDNDLIKYAQLLQNKDDWSYILELLQEANYVNQESFEIQEYLKKEQCNLSVVFVLQIVAYIFRDKYSLFGGLNISNQKGDNTFLIKKEFTNIFDFEKFIAEFTNHIADNETEYDLNIDDCLSNTACWTSIIDLNKFDTIISIVKGILLYEFYLYSNLDGLITIPATKERNPLDIVYDILKEKGEPMHIDDIFVEFKKILPEHKYTEAAQLRPYLQRHESISYRNRSSIYTLKEWEHIKAGTIRDSIIELLLENDLPQTADNITEYVLLHFPETNIASVRTSMFNDTQKRFSFFGNGLFGLASKEYPAEYEEIEQQEGQRKSFEQRLYDFEKFLTENDHFPFSTSDNEDETSLYRWWRIQSKSVEKLTTKQKAEIERIKLQYADFETDKTIYEWFYHFNNFKLFVLENRRLPSTNGTEKFLYGWFRRVKDDFLNDHLSEKQRVKYAELFKEISYVEK